ncbi:MAG: hypothetical protein ACXWAT_16270 [Methylobacter sp.]
MSDFYKDILTGTIFITGLLGFVSGEYITSSALRLLPVALTRSTNEAMLNNYHANNTFYLSYLVA